MSRRFAHPGSDSESRYGLRCRATSLALTQNAPGHNFSFSDHFGLGAVFDIVAIGWSNDDSKRNEAKVDTVPVEQLAGSRLPPASTTLAQPTSSSGAFVSVRPTREQVLQDTLKIITLAYDASYQTSFRWIILSGTAFAC